MVLSKIMCSLYILYFLMSDTSDRTVIMPVTHVHPQQITYLAFTMHAIKSPPILLQPVEYNKKTNLYYVRYIVQNVALQ